MVKVESNISSPKKRRSKSEPGISEVSPEKKAKTFCCQTFRRELKGSEPLKSVKRFIQAAKNTNEVIYDYLDCGGSLQEILSLIDVTAVGDLTTALPVFEVVHLILLRFQSEKSMHYQRCIESAKTILRSHLPIIKAMLSMNITKQKKVALKLLTAIVTLDSTFASEIINVVALSPGLISDLIKPTPEKESVRKCFILFLLSFLVEENTVVLKNLLEKKGFLGSIIPGLKFDEADIVNLTLSCLDEKILKNVKVTKTLKLKLFNTQVIRALFDLFDWKGLQGIKQIGIPKEKKKRKVAEVNHEEKKIVTESIYSFLQVLCCSRKHGVIFFDKSLGTSNQINNELLLTVFESLSDPLQNPRMADIVLRALSNCPDIVTPVLNKFEPLFQPRDSKNWFDAIHFAENLVKNLDAATLLKNETEPSSVKRIVKVAQTLCAPVVFLRVIKTVFKNSHSTEIQLHSLKLLSTLWKETEKLFFAHNLGSQMKKPLYYYFSKFLPNAEDLIQLWHTLCKTEAFSFSFLTYENSLYLSVVLDVLHVIVECHKEEINLVNLTVELLNYIKQTKETMKIQEFSNIQVKILRFMENDLESLIYNADLFQESLLILLHSADSASFSYLSKILDSLNVFLGNKSEIDIWVLCYVSLPKEYCIAVAKYFVESIRRCFEARIEMNRLLMNCSSAKEIKFNGVPEKCLTNLIFSCLEVLRFHLAESLEDQKIEVFQYFVNDVIIHLQHFYSIEVCLYDRLKGFKKIINKLVLNYLKNWKQNLVENINSEIFSCPFEFSLVSWLLDTEDNRKFEEVIELKTLNLLRLQSLFRIIVAYLNIKIKNECWFDNDISKYSGALFCLLKTDVDENDQDVDIISYDFNNASVYKRKCLNCLLFNNHLLDKFDIFRKKQNHPTAIAVVVLIENQIFGNTLVKKNLTYPWKCKFLNQLMTKLRKNKSINGYNNIEKVINFFDYDESDTIKVIDFFKTVSDLNMFIDGNSPSLWITIMTKFCLLYCRKEELPEVILKKLCLIMQNFCEKCVINLEILDNCFVHLLRSHPRHLLFINNEFLRVILQRSNTTSVTHTLGKLLLNDPDKAKYFFKIVKDEVEMVGDSQFLLTLFSILIVNENIFLQTLKLKEAFEIWRSSEINEENTPDVYYALEAVYKKFEKNIFHALTGKKEELIFKNLSIAREMVKLFVDKKQIIKMQNGIRQGKFEPELLFEAVRKFNNSALTDSYMEGLLTMFCCLIKNSLNDEDKDVWAKYCTIISDLIKLKDSWENLMDSLTWKEFTKLALGHCFSSANHPLLLKILRMLIETFYTTQESQDCRLIFQMTISHSQFLKIFLCNSLLKNELVELFYSLIKLCPSEMSSSHIPILLASYNASLSPHDITLLNVLRLYEKNQVKISEYEPFVWGETAVSHYSIGTNRGLSLWQRFNMGNILNLLDLQRMEMSLKEFPIHRDLEINITQNKEYDSIVYDPFFILPLFVNLLSPGSVAYCLSFVYRGGLGYTVRALSSECKDVRALAAMVLARFYNHLELSQNLKQKLVWMHFINCFRYGIEDLAAKPLPNVTTLFLARMTFELSRHPAEMYLPLQHFLLAKSYFSFDAVPEFLPLFCSSEVSYWKHRVWLLEVMRDGTKAVSDISIIFRSMAVKVLFSFFHSHLCDNETKKLTIQVVERMLRIDESVLLISEYGLLNWITSIDAECYQFILKDLLILLSTTLNVIAKDLKVHKATHSDFFHVTQILNMALKVLPSLKSLKSVEIFKIYLKLLLSCLILFVEEGKTQWFQLNKNRLIDLIDAGSVNLGVYNNFEKFCEVSFYFNEFLDFNNEVREDLKNSVFLFNVLLNLTVK